MRKGKGTDCKNKQNDKISVYKKVIQVNQTTAPQLKSDAGIHKLCVMHKVGTCYVRTSGGPFKR